MSLKCIVCLLVFIASTRSSSIDWERFKSDYNKEYASIEEEIERREIFLENVNRINEYQRVHPDATFTMGINHLTDRRSHELVFQSKLVFNSPSEETDGLKSIIPIWLDWRSKNVITPVYNQSSFESTPSIVAVEIIESYHAITNGNITRGSIDQVNACCQNVSDIFECILEKSGGGICSEHDYHPFNGTCHPDGCKPFVTFNQVNRINPPNEATILEWIQDSPLFALIDASQLSFQSYTSGIYSNLECSKTDVNHAVQLVGYGFRSGIPYWLCKNSWGEGWGEGGYIRLERGKNTCGIANHVVQISTKADVPNNARGMNSNFIYWLILSLLVYLK